MDWQKLLSPVRIRDLYGGDKSHRSPGDFRTEFERDYGRSVFSSPVRRLQDKAQVFPMEEHDSIRTRLTHSVEVSSVARNIGTQLSQWLSGEKGFEAQTLAPIGTIAATCGLLHDIGNPPFGHAGEKAIGEWFIGSIKGKFPSGSQLESDFAKWEGNAQTIRLVSKLQVLADDFGLNLTCGTLSALCKYVSPSHETNPEWHECSKPGYFFSETELIRRLRDQTGTYNARNPITYLAEASDDIVYSTVDLEDGVKKRLLTWRTLEEALQQEAGNDTHYSKAMRLTKEYIGKSLNGHMRDEGLVQAFRTFAINEMVVSVVAEFKSRYDLIMAGEYHGELISDCSAGPLAKACKKIARDFVYTSEDVMRLELTGRKIISDLLAVFWEGASVGSKDMSHKSFGGKAYLLTSANYRHIFEAELAQKTGAADRAPELYYRLQLVCDHVAGMTDSFAASLHRQLMNA